MFTWTRPFFVVAILSAALLSGCSEPAEVQFNSLPAGAAALFATQEPEQVITDPAGDAYEFNSNWAKAQDPCVVTQPPVPPPSGVPTVVCGTVSGTGALGSGEAAGAVPSSPARDLLGVTIQESPTTLSIRMTVAGLSQDLSEATAPAPGSLARRSTGYVVIWVETGSNCRVSTEMVIHPTTNGVSFDAYTWMVCPRDRSDAELRNSTCQAPLCFWQSEFDIQYGAPAVLQWVVPRYELGTVAPGSKLTNLRASTYSFYGQPEETSSSVSTRGLTNSWTRAPLHADYEVDASAPVPDFTFKTPAAPQAPRSFPVHVASAMVLPTLPTPQPETRLLGGLFEESPSRMRVTIEFETVAATPINHTLGVDVGLPGFNSGMGYTARDGQREPFANSFTNDGLQTSFPVTMLVQPGSPGKIIFEVERAALPPIRATGLITGFWAATFTETVTYRSLGNVEVRVAQWEIADHLQNGAGAALTQGSAGKTDTAGRFSDPPNDVVRPMELMTAPSSRFDLLGAELVSTAPGQVRISLAVSDLSDLDDRGMYEGVFYVVGLETEEGQTMVGYYRGNDAPSGKFFCAPDTTVFQSRPGDPQASVQVTNILGRVVGATSGGRSGGSTSGGSFVMFAPAFCFGLTEQAPTLEVLSMKAGAYLIRRAPSDPLHTNIVTGQVDELDSLAADNFTVHFATIAAPPGRPFWEAPFGIEQFWDVLGGVIAVLTILATLFLFARRRSLMKRYLHDVARIETDNPMNPQLRAAALVAIRRRLHGDIIRHRVSDSGYLLDRIRSSITSARLVSIGEGFYDLPVALALRIERLLDDGRMTLQEAGMLEPLVQRSNLPPRQKNLLIGRLQIWVKEDSYDLK